MKKSTGMKSLIVLTISIFLALFIMPMTDVSAATGTCAASGCNKKRWNKSSYCSTCQCAWSGCGAKRMSGSSYCAKHRAEILKPGKSTSSYSSKSSYSSSKSSYSSGKKSNTSSKKNSSNRKYNMPDCDDYEDYDDFMDDWDGCMPDGSDAEDYWEDW